jgi:hypothetical protein
MITQKEQIQVSVFETFILSIKIINTIESIIVVNVIEIIYKTIGYNLWLSV